MRKTITPSEMKRVETQAMRAGRVTGDALMQRAAWHVARAVGRGPALCVCGTGNNGGDGLAAMRLLAQQDPAFWGECWLLPGALSADAARELERLRTYAPRVKVRRLEADEPPFPDGTRVAVDAMFGTGLSRPLEGLARELCVRLNQSGLRVVAVDIPSGLCGETGRVLGAAVRADETVTFHRPKPGLYLGDGPDMAGRITVGEIGLPADLDDADGFALLEESDLRALLPPRRRVTHKGSYGRVLLWAGSPGMAGAAALCATAALRSGAGLVTVACPQRVMDTVQTLCPCATCVPLQEDPGQAWAQMEAALERADALAAGCGLGTSPWAEALMERLMERLSACDLPAVLDADALNLLSRRGQAQGNLYLTPHPAEAARLLGGTVGEIAAQPVEAARALSARYGAAVALKGAVSVLCAQNRVALNPFGTPAMAKGGSGDVLTGVVAALLANRAAGALDLEPLCLLQAACALHGLAGERAALRTGERGLLAADLCQELGKI